MGDFQNMFLNAIPNWCVQFIVEWRTTKSSKIWRWLGLYLKRIYLLWSNIGSFQAVTSCSMVIELHKRRTCSGASHENVSVAASDLAGKWTIPLKGEAAVIQAHHSHVLVNHYHSTPPAYLWQCLCWDHSQRGSTSLLQTEQMPVSTHPHPHQLAHSWGSEVNKT